MKLNRILNLIKYDWSLYKHNFLMTLAIFAGIFLVCGGVTFGWNLLISISNPASYSFMPISMMIFASNFLEYGVIIMAIIVTVVLHHKFSNPRTATAYLTLPGTSAEKLVVLCIDYIVGGLSVLAIMYAGLLLFSLLGWCIAPDADWFIAFHIGNNMETLETVYAGMRPANGNDPETFAAVLAEMEPMLPGFGSKINELFYTMKYFGIFSSAASCLFYMMLNLCFKKNGQLKAIASEIGIGIVFAIAMIAFFVIFVISNPEGWSPVNAAGDVSPSNMTGPAELIKIIFGTILWYIRLTPVICAVLLGIIYKQISRKQPY